MTDREISERFRLREEDFEHSGFSARLYLPDSSEALIDEAEFDQDERLPYWAELWPAARALSRFLLDQSTLQSPAIELGCGVALPSLVLRGRGVDVLATDYYADALRFARHNAQANGVGPLPTRLLDWRQPPPGLGRFPLVIAADVLYEERNGDALLSFLPVIVEKRGEVLLADPDRIHLTRFLDRAGAAGWRIEHLPHILEDAPAGNGIKTTVRLMRLLPPIRSGR